MTPKFPGLAAAVTAAVMAATLTAAAGADTTPARRAAALQNLKHVIVVMQANHSFDNYFGALAYTPDAIHHPAADGAGCDAGDHGCVDGLSCLRHSDGTLACVNANPGDDGGKTVTAFHDPNRCVGADLDRGWPGSHLEANFASPNDALRHFRGDGFVRRNADAGALDDGAEGAAEDDTMGFYTEQELPFYYDLAAKFAISDRHFGSILGPGFPNRAYALAATSFGHLTTSDELPPPNPLVANAGYKPLTGTIFDLLEANAVTWAEYYQSLPAGAAFRPFAANRDLHFKPYATFLQQAGGTPGLPELPQVAFVDPSFGVNDEHPPQDVQIGQALVSEIVNAVRNGPYWKDSIVFISYDEHGGFYDHVMPPAAPQGGARTPDGIAPGQCSDASNLPASATPGGGAECSSNLEDAADTSLANAEQLCPQLAANPAGAYPAQCASFDQLGFRVPFIAVSPFARPGYVSHTVSDHTSVLALIEKRFMVPFLAGRVSDDRPHLTRRDQFADTLEDMFDFENSPSLNTAVGTAGPPAEDCTPPGSVSAGP